MVLSTHVRSSGYYSVTFVSPSVSVTDREMVKSPARLRHLSVSPYIFCFVFAFYIQFLLISYIYIKDFMCLLLLSQELCL